MASFLAEVIHSGYRRRRQLNVERIKPPVLATAQTPSSLVSFTACCLAGGASSGAQDKPDEDKRRHEDQRAGKDYRRKV